MENNEVTKTSAKLTTAQRRDLGKLTKVDSLGSTRRPTENEINMDTAFALLERGLIAEAGYVRSHLHFSITAAGRDAIR